MTFDATAASAATQPRNIAHAGQFVTKVGYIAIYATLALIYFWFGGMKFTTVEAHGLQPLVANSPLLSWMYSIFSLEGFSHFLGVLEISVGLLIAARLITPAASALGGFLSAGLFFNTISFMFTTPGVWVPELGFPALASTGQFLVKDIVLFSGSVLVLGESLSALARSR